MVRGKYPIGVGLQSQQAVRSLKDGFKLTILRDWPDGPGYTSAAFGILGMFRNPPHPNAAKLFLNWILTKEGQIAWNSAWKTASVRTDVDNSWVPDFIVPKPGVKYMDAYDWDYAGKGVRDINDRYKTILAGRPTG